MKIAYFAQEHQTILDPYKTIQETVEDASLPEMRPQVRKILGGLGLQGDDIDKKIIVLSGGEKSRVRLAMLLVQEHNLLILDEPTHHLDMSSKDSLKEAIKNYNGTVLIVSHDREFLRDLAEKTYSFENKKIKIFEGDIDYYLSKKAAEESTANIAFKQNTAESKKTPILENTEDKKKYQKNLLNVEKEISRLDNKIKEIEIQMGDPEFYNSANSQNILKEYEKIKSEHSIQLAKWEEVYLLANA